MSQLEQLIRTITGETKVSWKRLDSIAIRRKGFPVTAKTINEQSNNSEGILVYGAGSTRAYFDASLVPEKNVIFEKCVIVKSRGYIDFEYSDQPCAHKSELWSYMPNESEINTKFLYYYLKTIKSKLQKLARATSVKIPQLSVGDTDSLRIPVPPLEVQDEIVRILDSFTELEARRKQYEYYRDSLLSFDNLESRLGGGELNCAGSETSEDL